MGMKHEEHFGYIGDMHSGTLSCLYPGCPKRIFTRHYDADDAIADAHWEEHLARGPMTGAELIAAERERQVGNGYGHANDATYTDNELRWAAACYLLDGHGTIDDDDISVRWWPWMRESWKPGDPIRNLTKAGALIAAEIDRLQRAQANE